MSETTDRWEERDFLWIGPSRNKMPRGYLPLFGIKLTANTNEYDEAGAGVEGLSVNAIKPARTLSSNRVLWENERAERAEEMSEGLREGFELWTRNYCQDQRQMMDRVADLFLFIFRQEEWGEIIEWIDHKVDSYLRGALDELLDQEAETGLTKVCDRILESEDIFALQLNAFGFVGVEEAQLEEVIGGVRG